MRFTSLSKFTVLAAAGLLFSLVFSTTALRAQYFVGAIGSTTWIGFEGGLSLASQAFDSVPQSAISNLKTGVLGGIKVEHWFSNNWAVNIGLLYDQKGVTEVYSPAASNRDDTFGGGTIYSGSDNFSMNYLEIPIIVKFALGKGTVRPYLFAGPSIGVLLSASESASGSLASLPNFKSYLKSTDISVYGGLGLMDEIERGPIISFELGFASGVANIYQSVPARFATNGRPFLQPIDQLGVKSNDFRISLGAEWKI